MKVSVLDYGAGNVRSLINALQAVGCEIEMIDTAEQISSARVLIFPGVGACGACMEVLQKRGWVDALRAYVQSDKPFLGICLGLQTLFEGSEESPGVRGLGLLPGIVGKFSGAGGRSVPQIGWNTLRQLQPSPLFHKLRAEDAVYFVHSFRVAFNDAVEPWALTLTDYGEEYVSSVQRGRVMACQFHPEKSGPVGLRMLHNFASAALAETPAHAPPPSLMAAQARPTRYCKRVIACMDVRANDAGDLVCTKGDQYDVREKADASGAKGGVRNLGKPVQLARRYYEQGADEITFLNITGFRDCPLTDTPMLALIEEASKEIFVPLTVGGGIRGFTDSNGVTSNALQVADAYFRAGADKVSIGSDAVDVAKAYLASGKMGGDSSIEQISRVYGRQAVVVSIDPRRRWVKSAADADGHNLVDHASAPDKGVRGPNGESLCWYECTVQGGRKGSGLDIVQLARAVEALGCGEILLNCIDNDGQNDGYDLHMTRSVHDAVGIPVIASSGAGAPRHFSEVFEVAGVEAGLAASIFHKSVCTVGDVKADVAASGIHVRPTANVDGALLAAGGGGRAGGWKWLVALGVLAAAVTIGVAAARK